MERRAWRNVRVLVLVLGLVVVMSSCKFSNGCKQYTLFEPPTFQLTVDESACEVPPAVVPEVPMVVLLPVLAFASLTMGAKLTRAGRVRRRAVP